MIYACCILNVIKLCYESITKRIASYIIIIINYNYDYCMCILHFCTLYIISQLQKCMSMKQKL